ncbi:MAG TPA: OsmC family protein [Bryobacterales bacterium]|nr:OsmC family protein [Bryobacterales bacterium]
MSENSYFYATQIQWAGKRRGDLHAAGLPPLTVSTPPEFKGEAGFWTPEHLFVAAAESCLMATFLGIAENSGLSVVSYRSSACGNLEKLAGIGLRFTAITIYPIVELENAEYRPRAERVMAKAGKGCLIANSMALPLRVEPTFVVAAADRAISAPAA